VRVGHLVGLPWNRPFLLLVLRPNLPVFAPRKTRVLGSVFKSPAQGILRVSSCRRFPAFQGLQILKSCRSTSHLGIATQSRNPRCHRIARKSRGLCLTPKIDATFSRVFQNALGLQRFSGRAVRRFPSLNRAVFCTNLASGSTQQSYCIENHRHRATLMQDSSANRADPSRAGASLMPSLLRLLQDARSLHPTPAWPTQHTSRLRHLGPACLAPSVFAAVNAIERSLSLRLTVTRSRLGSTCRCRPRFC